MPVRSPGLRPSRCPQTQTSQTPASFRVDLRFETKPESHRCNKIRKPSLSPAPQINANAFCVATLGRKPHGTLLPFSQSAAERTRAAAVPSLARRPPPSGPPGATGAPAASPLLAAKSARDPFLQAPGRGLVPHALGHGPRREDGAGEKEIKTNNSRIIQSAV